MDANLAIMYIVLLIELGQGYVTTFLNFFLTLQKKVMTNTNYRPIFNTHALPDRWVLPTRM